MTNRQNLSAQLTAYTVTHTASAAAAWAAALRHLDPEGLQAIAATMPASTMGDSLRSQLETLAHELNTAPLALGAK